MINVRNLCHQYNNGSKVLKDISFNISMGEFAAVIGQNGAGKTTLLKHLNGLLKPSSGKVLVKGLDTAKTKTSVLSRHIGFLFQNPDHQIFCSTVYEEIAFGPLTLGKSRDEADKLVREAAGQVGLTAQLESEPFSLSKGQRQRVALASVLAAQTDILVLDEPTTGQDYKESMEIMEIIRELNSQGKTIIMVTHDMELVAAYAKRVIILSGGRVLEDGPVEDVLSKAGSLEQSSLTPPQAFLLAKKFHKQGFFKKACTVEDIYEEIINYVEGKADASNG